MHSSQKVVSAVARCFRCTSRFNASTALRSCQQWQVRKCSSAILSAPSLEGEEKKYPENIQKIVDDISRLSLLEVADLNDLLKKTLKITDAPMMQMAAAIPAGQASEDEAEEKEVVKEKTTFTVRILNFAPDKKTSLIKEIKSVIEGMNLVQAKKFVESVPSIVKTDIPKDEAEALKERLSAAGGTVEIN